MSAPPTSVDERFAALDERIKRLRRRLPVRPLPAKNAPPPDPEAILQTVLWLVGFIAQGAMTVLTAGH
jgi:hypothetical protein